MKFDFLKERMAVSIVFTIGFLVGIEILSDNQSYGKRKYDPNDDQRLFHIAGKVILRMQR